MTLHEKPPAAVARPNEGAGREQIEQKRGNQQRSRGATVGMSRRPSSEAPCGCADNDKPDHGQRAQHEQRRETIHLSARHRMRAQGAGVFVRALCRLQTPTQLEPVHFGLTLAAKRAGVISHSY